MAARFSGPQTAPGSPKINGNKGVLRAYRLRKREEAEQRNENNRRAQQVTVKGVHGTLKPEEPKDGWTRDTKGKRRKRGHKKRLVVASEQLQALADMYNTND